MYTYHPRGTCCTQIEFDIDDNGVITYCHFTNGCRGNTQGVAALVKGMKAEDAIAKLEGIQCRSGTSCPDQLAKALKLHI